MSMHGGTKEHYDLVPMREMCPGPLGMLCLDHLQPPCNDKQKYLIHKPEKM